MTGWPAIFVGSCTACCFLPSLGHKDHGFEYRATLCVSLHVFSVFVLSGVGRGPTSGRSLIEGIPKYLNMIS
jgi:hypothetical protein